MKPDRNTQFYISMSRSEAMWKNTFLNFPEGLASEVILGPFPEFIQITYETLRVGTDGDFIGYFRDGYWWINPDDRESTGVLPDEFPFSDVTVFCGND